MLTDASQTLPPQPGRRRLSVVVLGVVALFIVGQVTANIWTDLLWFRSLGYEAVWSTMFWTKAGLAAVGITVAFGLLWANFVATDRISPRVNLLAADEDDEMMERLSDWLEPRLRRLRLIVAATFAIPIGLGQTVVAMDLLRFLNPESFGIVDPIYGNDVGFYMFRVPFIADITAFLLSTLILTLMTTVGAALLQWGNQAGTREGATSHPRCQGPCICAVGGSGTCEGR